MIGKMPSVATASVVTLLTSCNIPHTVVAGLSSVNFRLLIHTTRVRSKAPAIKAAFAAEFPGVEINSYRPRFSEYDGGGYGEEEQEVYVKFTLTPENLDEVKAKLDRVFQNTPALQGWEPLPRYRLEEALKGTQSPIADYYLK